jgi:hypothetical protein
MNATTTAPAHHRPDSRRPIPWRRVAGATIAVLAAGGLGAFIRDTTASNHRSAAPSASSSSTTEAESIWSAMLQLDSEEAAAVRAGLPPDMRAAIDELDEDLVEREAARRASPTLDITEMYGAFWAAPPLPPSTLDITEMYGAFSAAPPLPPSTLDITEMYGAFSAAPPSPALIAALETPSPD